MRLLAFLIALLVAAPALAADRVIINPDQDGDLKLKVNDGGAVTDVLTLRGSTSQVGVGTTAPAYLLEVKKSIAADYVSSFENTSATGFGLTVVGAGNTVTQELFKVRRNTSTDSLLVYGNGQTALSGGAETAPGVAFLGDLNTGIYSTGSEELAITTNGTADFRSAGDFFFMKSGWTIRANTSNGSDTESMAIGAGGDSATARGSYIQLWGNQNPSGAGDVIIAAGDQAEATLVSGQTATIDFRTGGSNSRMTISELGAVNISTDGTEAGGNVPHACTRRTQTTAGTDATVTCSAGEIVTGGGCDCATCSGATLQISFPNGDNSFFCRYVGAPTSAIAWAVCCDY